MICIKHVCLAAIAATTLVFGVEAIPTSQSSAIQVHESLPAIPKRWSYHSEAHGNEVVHLQIAMKDQDETLLDIARAVSDPNSNSYGKHLSHTELKDALPDFHSTAEAVGVWLKTHDIVDAEHDGEWVTFTTTVDDAKKLLNADFGWYQFGQEKPVLRTLSYDIPDHMTKHIDFVYPTVHFIDLTRKPPVQPQLRKRIPPANPNCTNSVCPAQIKDMYNINYSPSGTTSKSKIGVAGFLEEYANCADVHSFLTRFGLKNYTTPSNFTIEDIHGGLSTQNETLAGAEANLDVEYALAFTHPLQVTYYSTGGRPPTLSQPGNKSVPASKSQNEPYTQFLNYLSMLEDPPQVISISYTDDEDTVPIAYAQKVCNMFGRLAARGISVIASSGDGGSSGSSDECIAPDEKSHRFSPGFPATCPWVTAVGASRGSKPHDYAATYSGGGFSNVFGTPEWQKDAVAGYQDKLGKNIKKYFNASGRGIPDVAVVGDDFLFVSGGYDGQVSGTSAATPVFAAMLALLNDIRLKKGMPVLGFLNPLLYSANISSHAFADVTRGQTSGCYFDSTSVEGFSALKGWDAATGLGTPKFPKLRAALT